MPLERNNGNMRWYRQWSMWFENQHEGRQKEFGSVEYLTKHKILWTTTSMHRSTRFFQSNELNEFDSMFIDQWWVVDGESVDRENRSNCRSKTNRRRTKRKTTFMAIVAEETKQWNRQMKSFDVSRWELENGMRWHNDLISLMLPIMKRWR